MTCQSSCAYNPKHPRILHLLPGAALLFACFLLLSYPAGAQPPRPHQPVRLNPKLDKLEYQGFTIRLIPTFEGYYGYDILKGSQLIQHQVQSPLPGKPLEKREDAFAAAKQSIAEYLKTGQVPPAIPPRMFRQPSSSVNPVKP